MSLSSYGDQLTGRGMMQPPLLSIRAIKKNFSGVHALVDGSLELERGDIHALCGGNGAGKSTLLNILMGFTRPD